MTHWSFILIRGSHDPVYFRAADVGFNVLGMLDPDRLDVNKGLLCPAGREAS